MATAQVWRLKRYGRLVSSSKKNGRWPWKIFEATVKKPEIVLKIVESGHLLVLQGDACLDIISLSCGSDCLNVHQKSDTLVFRRTVNGKNHMMRMHFDGSSKAEAIKECSEAVERLMEHMPVTTQNDIPASSNQPPTVASAPVIQCPPAKTLGNEPDVVQGSLSLKDLAQVCLLDPSFHAFVEKVEGELRKLLQE